MTYEARLMSLLNRAVSQEFSVSALRPPFIPSCSHDMVSSTVDVLRLDAIHPVLSGNKLFKLAGYLADIEEGAGSCLITPGGVYSNHLHAVAAAGAWLGIPTVGLVRGYASQALTPTLQDCQHWGMKLVFLDRKTYACRYDPAWQQQQASAHQAVWIGEGGAGAEALCGGRYLAQYCDGYDEVWLAVGSGTTASMLQPFLGAQTRLVGVNVVADQGKQQRLWKQSFPAETWTLIETASWGRFGRLDDVGRALIQQADQAGLPLDPVYGVRLLRAFLEHGPTVPGARCLLIHGGGLQGRRGYGLDWPLVGHHEPALDFPPAMGT